MNAKLIFFLIANALAKISDGIEMSKFKKVPFLPRWKNTVFKTQAIAEQSIIECAGLCANLTPSSCQFFFMVNFYNDFPDRFNKHNSQRSRENMIIYFALMEHERILFFAITYFGNL